MAQGPKDKGEKRKADDVEGAPAEGAAALTVRDLVMEQCGKTDGLEKVRNDFKESLAQHTEQHERCMERMRRDADAGEQGNKWHKGINIQLDLHEDAGRHLKRAEEKISRVLLAVPTALAREALLEGKQIGLGDFELMGLKALPGVKDAVSEMGLASGLLGKRSHELTVVRNAPSAKVGYRTLDIMANAGNLSPGADKALKEAIRLVEEEEKEAKKKKEVFKEKQQPKAWAPRAERQGGWGSTPREQWQQPEPQRGGWGEDRQSRSNHSSPAQARGGSQGMPWSGGKGSGGKGGGEGSCNACGEYGHWARDCRSRRSGWQ
jgi:hypothetical protein